MRAPVSGSSAEAGRSSACAIARNTLTDGLPAPLSICARYRSEVAGGLGQLAARHAALGAVLSHFAPDGGKECGSIARFAVRKQQPALQASLALAVGLATVRVLMHHNSWLIMHTRPGIGKLRRRGQALARSKIFRQPRLCGSAAVRFLRSGLGAWIVRRMHKRDHGFRLRLDGALPRGGGACDRLGRQRRRLSFQRLLRASGRSSSG